MSIYQMLEEDLARWIGVRDVAVCSSGTAALHLALESFQFPNRRKDIEVILCDYNMVACALAIEMADMVPVCVDCNHDLLINPVLIEDAITERTSFIMAVHTYGRVCDMDAIHSVARERGLCVIEDMAEAHGIAPDPRTHAACWSFYRNKVVHGEEGGCVTFKEGGHNHYTTVRQLRNMGFNEPHDYSHIPRGHNYRMSNAHAALVLDSLRSVDCELLKRRRREDWLNDHCPDHWYMPYRVSPWVYDLRIPGMTDDLQTGIICDLRANGIEARHGFKPITTQKQFRMNKRVGGDEARRASREVIYLPLDESMTQERAKTAFDIITTHTRYGQCQTTNKS